MRMLLTSVDAEGCSCVVTKTDLGGIAGEAKRAAVLWPPGQEAELHHTTDDYEVVLERSVELILDDGPHPLGAGDVAVLTALDPAWSAKAEGAPLAVVAVGSAPAA